MEIMDHIKQTIKSNPIVIFMKGTPQAPQCGFSMRASQALTACGVQYAHVDVLAEPEVRQTLPQISQWPTFPQIFINGELIGGCDIVMEMYQKGELQKLAQAAAKKH
jgi:monothiol glutaredoxin